MIYGSVCSGIEAATVAWHPLGWEPAFFSEIDAFPRALLAHHYPEVPLHGDFTTIQAGQYRPIDLLVGGTPCQSFSVAGLRGGMDDDRGNLALEFLRLADRLRPQWVVWENVPGILSSNGGRDFGSFVGGLGQLGYGWAYRVLDAQFFNLAQRRARVFVVGCLGDWRAPAAVLFEPESLSGNPAPSRRPGKGSAGDAQGGPDGGRLAVAFGGNNTQGAIEVSTAVRAHGAYHGDFESETFIAEAPMSFDVKRGLAPHGAAAESEIASPLTASDYKDPQLVRAVKSKEPITLAERGRDGESSLEWRQDGTSNAVLTPGGGRGGLGVGAVAFQQNTRDEVRLLGGDGQIAGALASNLGMKQQNYVAGAVAFSGDVARTLLAEHDGGAAPDRGMDVVAQGMQVRRLTPTECERLQGFPDGYTAIPYRGKPAADGPRYKGIGNSMAVPVMAWIGRRIDQVDKIRRGQ